MKKILVIVLVVASIFIYTSCQQIFTYSALEWAQRDPANLSTELQIIYAEDALARGDQAAAEEMYDILNTNTDPDVQVLVSQLAVTASGLDAAISDALTTMAFDSTIIASIDNAWLVNATDAMLIADVGNADIAPEEYLSVAAALVVLDAQANGDTLTAVIPSSVAPPAGSDLENAVYYAEAAGFTEADLADMFGI